MDFPDWLLCRLYTSNGKVGKFLNYASEKILSSNILRPEITISKKEVVTLREFHPELHDYFNDPASIKNPNEDDG